MIKRCLLILVCISLLAASALAWGDKGHQMAARAAARALPKDMPDFFRNATDRLAYLCPEPDRWRSNASPALGTLNAPDHYFDLEAWGADALPASRYDLLVLAVKKGIIHYDPLNTQNRRGAPTGDKFVSDVGTAPYAVAEMAGKLVSNMREWRDASDDTPGARIIKQQLQENIIYVAGVMAHYVTDLGNPMHCTVHFNGWAEGYPNPRNFPVGRAADNIHARFESNYVGRAIEEKDIEPLLTAPHRVGPWVADMEAFLRRNNGFIDQLYTIDQQGAFGSGKEPAEAKLFTAQRLGDAASMLRDVWTTAWAISGDEWLNERASVYTEPGKTMLEMLRSRHHNVVTETRDGLLEVVGIGNRKNGLDGRVWQLYINNAPAKQSIDKYLPAPGERIEFRFEKPAAAQKAA